MACGCRQGLVQCMLHGRRGMQGTVHNSQGGSARLQAFLGLAARHRTRGHDNHAVAHPSWVCVKTLFAT